MAAGRRAGRAGAALLAALVAAVGLSPAGPAAAGGPDQAAAADPGAAPRRLFPALPVETVLETVNPHSVQGNPTAFALFTLDRPFLVTRLTTYHWNGGRGAVPGLVALYGSDDEVYGPFLTEGLPGPGGLPDAWWETEPRVILQPGQYIVLVSDHASWSQNAASGGVGFVRVEGAWW